MKNIVKERGNEFQHGKLYGKYIISHSDGSPVDPEAQYLVLRLDKDSNYGRICRETALRYAYLLRTKGENENEQELGRDLEVIITNMFTEILMDSKRNNPEEYILPEDGRCKQHDILDCKKCKEING